MNFLKIFKESKLFYFSVEALILATLLFIATKLDFLYQPLGAFFSALFAPILISGFLFYLLNPIVTILEKKLKIKRILGIVFVFLLLIIILAVAFLNLIPNLLKQMSDLAGNVPRYASALQKWALKITKSSIFKNVDLYSYIKELNLSYSSIISNTINQATRSISSIFSVITSTLMTIVTVPFILFYMLKDGNKLLPKIINYVPQKNRKGFLYLFNQMNNTIATYISGQVIECCFVGTCMVIGYLALGVEYGFLFGIIAGLTNLIPYLGPYLGLAPALLATVFSNPVKGIFCIILVIIVQQLDGNIIYPNVIGKTLKIHPLTIIFVLLVAGNLAGLVGILLGVPVYAISRTILKFLITIYQGRREQEKIVRQEELLK